LRRTNDRQRQFRTRVVAVLCAFGLVGLLVAGGLALWVGASNHNTGHVVADVQSDVAGLETRFEQFTLDFGPRVGVLEATVAGSEAEIANLRAWLGGELGYVRGDIGRVYNLLDARLSAVEGNLTADQYRLMVLGVLAECGIPCRTCEAPGTTVCPSCPVVTVTVTTVTVPPSTTTSTTEGGGGTTTSTTSSTTTTVAPSTTTTTSSTTTTTVPPTTTTTVAMCPPERNPLPYPIPATHPHCGAPQPPPPSGG
jgi:hypothetical protein